MRTSAFRGLVLAALLFLAGVPLTVAAAWYCSAFRSGLPLPMNGRTLPRPWPGPVPATWPSAPGHGSWMGRAGFRYTSDGAANDQDSLQYLRFESGWPMRSMVWEHLSEASDIEDRHALKPGDWGYREGVAVPWSPRFQPGEWHARLPFKIIPFGFAVDAASFGAILALAPMAILVQRFVKRRRVGRCQKCGYSRDGLPAHAACPECGELAAGGGTAPIGA